MHVNSLNRVFRSEKFKFFAAIMVALCAIFFLAAFITGGSDEEIFSKRVNIAVRAIGHDLLLRAGDSTSVVRPVIEKSKGVFLLQFENELAFQPDTLVAIVQRSLAKTAVSNYTVTVHECHRSNVVVYGFEINPPNNSVMPCLGRSQPKACYNIEIAFADFSATITPYASTAIVISCILSVLAIALIGRNLVPKKSKPVAEQNTTSQNEINASLTIGGFIFNSNSQCLKMGEQIISLTDKECKILTLLNKNIGQLTLREDLIQEVWTDEGVITGRSLDMFISKLRKKISADPYLRITNVHGKGYKLEIADNLLA